MSENIPHSLGGFRGAFESEHGRKPTEQEIWNAAIRSWRDLHPQATEPAWRPIESAPKDGTEIIGCWPSYIDSGSFARVTCKYVGWSWVTNDYRETELAQPTYWMPLPAAPKAHHGK